MYNTDALINEYTNLEKFVNYQIEQIKNNSFNSVNVILEIPRGCAYKLEHSRGIYWVIRPLEKYVRLPIAYGFIENTISEDGKQLNTYIYIPPNVNQQFINNSEIGFKCIALLGLKGENIKIVKGVSQVMGSEYKIITIPEIFLDELLKDVNSVSAAILEAIYSLHTNYNQRVHQEGNVFKISELMDYFKTNSILESSNIDKY